MVIGSSQRRCLLHTVEGGIANMMFTGQRKFKIVCKISNHTVVHTNRRAMLAGRGKESVVRLSIKSAWLAFIGFIGRPNKNTVKIYKIWLEINY